MTFPMTFPMMFFCDKGHRLLLSLPLTIVITEWSIYLMVRRT